MEDLKGTKKQNKKMKMTLKKMNNKKLGLLSQNLSKKLRLQVTMEMKIKMIFLEDLPMLLRELWKKLTVRKALM